MMLPGAGREVRFLRADYTHQLDLSDGGVDLLISLFAGPVWEHCDRYLRPGDGCWPTPAGRPSRQGSTAVFVVCDNFH